MGGSTASGLLVLSLLAASCTATTDGTPSSTGDGGAAPGGDPLAYGNSDEGRTGVDTVDAAIACVSGGLDSDEFDLPACEDAAVAGPDAGPPEPPLDEPDSGSTPPDAPSSAADSCADAAGECTHDGSPVSCCAQAPAPGGSFRLGRCGGAGAGCTDAYDGYNTEVPEHDATVSPFALDRFEVTVGRFRRFVDQYDGTPPVEGAGAHPAIAGSGWQSAWNVELPATGAELAANVSCAGKSDVDPTWTDAPGPRESYAISCVSWYEAFAFCVWEGKRLPTNAEWEFVAAGGEENRLFPWGSTPPSGAIVNSLIDKDTSVTPAEWLMMQFVPVGSFPGGVGRWGHYDLAGNMAEWVLDVVDAGMGYPSGTTPCNDCADLVPGPSSFRVLKGGNIHSREKDLRSAVRGLGIPEDRADGVSFRCASN